MGGCGRCRLLLLVRLLLSCWSLVLLLLLMLLLLLLLLLLLGIASPERWIVGWLDCCFCHFF